MLAKNWMQATRRPGLAMVAALMTAAGCDEARDDIDGFSPDEWRRVQQMEPLGTPMPRNPFNRQDTDRSVAKLGQMLFYETDYAEAITADGPSGMKGETGKVGCVTCHDPKRYFIDSRPGATVSHGRAFGRRNSPTMLNVGWYEWAGWTGRHDSLVMHGTGVMGTAATPLFYAHYLYRKYRAEYETAFPTTPLDPGLDLAAPDAARFPVSGGPKASADAPDGAWEKMTPDDQRKIQQVQANMGRVWDTYPRMLTTPGTPFERYVKGNHAALSPSAKRGLRLFMGKAACVECHNGPLLSDNRFHNIAVSKPVSAMAPDMGRFPDMAATLTSPFNGIGQFSDDPEAGRKKHMAINPTDQSMTGAFRTPMLLNIAETGPYYHTGEIANLEEVVRHYNKGGAEAGTFAGTKSAKLSQLNLSEPEIGDLVDFLKTLTAPLPPEEWTRDIAKH